ncbi:MAG: ribulose-phosphate 3-epimerase [Puniceicoccaceae bacterium MED-G32]|nr:MAG: ribulose-phosphate 3-epimerase [Puniceicoccaceae bacterium MED-G32]
MTHSLPNDSIILVPSILAADQGAIVEGVNFAKSAGVKYLHLDIMDGHFVPNISFGPDVVQSLRKKSDLFFDVHLMLSNPHEHYESFIRAGADLITIHVEPDYPIEETIKAIKDKGVFTGIAINPETPIEAVLPYLELVDLVLVMTVHPGFGGQKFISSCLDKVRALKEKQVEDGLDFRIEVDGGVNLDNANMCVHAGANTLVCGTSFYQSADPLAFHKQILSLKEGH